MSKYIIKLKSDGQYYSVDSSKTSLILGDLILVETEHGQEVAEVVPDQGEGKEIKNKREEKREDNQKKLEAVNDSKVVFIRKLNQKDLEKINKLAIEAKTYLIECHKKIEKYQLPMELLDVNLSYDEKKLTFYFTAPERVDFRNLVSDLAYTFKKVIRLQQVGARDEARYLGGIGRCGETLCCKKFLKGNLESVTLDMAYNQNLAQMGSNRITGVCGKLMCCLKYELDDYKKNKAKLPKVGEKIKTKKGNGVVVGQNILMKKVSVRLEDSDNIVEVNC